MDFDHAMALSHMKEIGRLLVDKILFNERVGMDTDPFRNLEAVMNIEILLDRFESALKRLEYLDPRESALFIDSSQVKKLMFDIYDLTSWYFKTYVNDRFSPPPLMLEPQIAALSH